MARKTSIHLPTIKQLRYLVALDEHKHFGRAAAACYVSQSAFSVAIKELENVLNLPLVDRTNKSVTITSVGQDVVTQARLCLRDIEGLIEVAQGRQAPLSGRLQLGVIPTIAPFLLPAVIPGIRKQYPKLQLYLREDITERIHADLMTGHLDAILIALPFALKNVQTLSLFKDAFRLACHRNTRLVDPKHYSLHSVPSETVLLLDDGHCLRDHALAACRIRNLDKVSKFSTTSLQTLVQMVDSDLGITFLPEMAEGSGILKNTNIKTYPLPDRSYREIALAWRRGSARAEEFRQLGSLITTYH